MEHINEENKDLNNKGGFIIVPDNFKHLFKQNKISYTTLTTKKSRLENNPNIGGDEKLLLQWINKKLDTEIAKNDGPKRARLNIDAAGTKKGVNGGNNFKNRTPDDSANNNVGKVGDIVKVTDVHESEINKEIESIRYLIEYMNNNKSKIIKS